MWTDSSYYLHLVSYDTVEVVQIRLFFQEGMHVKLLSFLDPLPNWATENTDLKGLKKKKKEHVMDRLSNVEFKFIWNSFFLVKKYEEVRTSANQDFKK